VTLLFSYEELFKASPSEDPIKLFDDEVEKLV
jgi:hypothetical protein